MILATWPSPAARAFAETIAGSVGIREVVEVAPYDSQKALLEGRVDLALIPAFDALRTEEPIDLIPGVGLVGAHSPTQVLAVSSPLDQITSVGFDPRFAQEVLLAQILLRENYQGKPTFAVADPSLTVSKGLSQHDAVLISPEDAPAGATILDLGQEWLELTLRPMVWGLLAGRGGEIEIDTARAIRDRVREASVHLSKVEGGHSFQFTLDGYAQDGLEELLQLMYYHGSLLDFPELPFIRIPDEQNESA